MRLNVLVALVVAICFESYTTDASPDADALAKQAHDQMQVRLLRGNGDVEEERAKKLGNEPAIENLVPGLTTANDKLNADIALTSNQIGHIHASNGQAIPHDNQLPVSPPSGGPPRDVTPAAAPQDGGFPIPVKPEGAKSPNGASEHPDDATLGHAGHTEKTSGNVGTETKKVVKSGKDGETEKDLLAKETMKAALLKLPVEDQAALVKGGVTPETLEATAKFAGRLVKLAAIKKDPSMVLKSLKGLYYLSGAGAIITIIIILILVNQITQPTKSTAPAGTTTAGGA